MSKISNIFVGLDVGTSEVRCVVGGHDGVQPLQILGIGTASNSGMRKGVVVHPDQVAEAIDSALSDVERTTGRRIRSVTVNINGVHIVSRAASGMVSVGNAEGLISEEDLTRVEDSAKDVPIPDNREIIRIFTRRYSVDGQSNVKDPRDMEGRRLGVESLILTGHSYVLRNLEAAGNTSGVKINNKTVSSLAVAEAALDKNARDHALAIVDIGATTTNLLIMDEGEIAHIAVIPVGGFHVTNDLARCLQVSIDVAEMIKKEHVDLDRKESSEKSEVFGKEEIKFSMADVIDIVEPRLEELCEELQKELQKEGYSRRLPGGMILSGGGSNLPGLAKFFKEKLKVYVRQAELQSSFGGLIEAVDKPEYMTATGLMVLDEILLSTTDAGLGQNLSMQSFRRAFNGLKTRFSKNN